MAKVYRTAKGQTLDIGSLLLQNENTRAVGNMGVNARGDKINSGNDIIKGRNEQMTQHYKKTYSKHVKDQPIYKNAAEAQAAMETQTVPSAKTVEPAPIASAVDDAAEVQATTQPVIEQPEPQKVPMSGLAGAIAKARSVAQEEEKTARQLQQEKEGVKRI